MKHFFLPLGSERLIKNVKKKKKERKKSWPFWGLNPRPTVSIHFTVILAYLNTLQSGDSALGVYYLKLTIDLCARCFSFRCLKSFFYYAHATKLILHNEHLNGLPLSKIKSSL
jgi:hypothetical protein